MSFAIYGESDSYVHLATGETQGEAIHEFIMDVMSVGVDIHTVYNVYAVDGRNQDVELEDAILELVGQRVFTR